MMSDITAEDVLKLTPHQLTAPDTRKIGWL
jgi:hypothetical protein